MKSKQVLILRKDLKMRRGKEISQGSHASLATLLNRKTDHVTNADGSGSITIPLTPEMNAWVTGRFIKITCYVNSEQELFDLYTKAKDAGLPCALIQDAGFTEFKEPTYTAVGIGPADEAQVDPITKHLPLY